MILVVIPYRSGTTTIPAKDARGCSVPGGDDEWFASLEHAGGQIGDAVFNEIISIHNSSRLAAGEHGKAIYFGGALKYALA